MWVWMVVCLSMSALWLIGHFSRWSPPLAQCQQRLAPALLTTLKIFIILIFKCYFMCFDCCSILTYFDSKNPIDDYKCLTCISPQLLGQDVLVEYSSHKQSKSHSFCTWPEDDLYLNPYLDQHLHVVLEMVLCFLFLGDNVPGCCRHQRYPDRKICKTSQSE